MEDYLFSPPPQPAVITFTASSSFKQRGPGGKESHAHCFLSNKDTHSHIKVENLWFNPRPHQFFLELELFTVRKEISYDLVKEISGNFVTQ